MLMDDAAHVDIGADAFHVDGNDVNLIDNNLNNHDLENAFGCC